MKKAFTLIELVVAVAILAMVLSFAGVIFKVSIGAYRTATANTEIMQKLRAITDQLNRDFKGLQKDGYLILHSEVQTNRREYQNSDPCNFRADRLYYFSTGDFQSWFDSNIRSNIARVYFGHEQLSLFDGSIPVSEWNLARDVMLLTPGYSSVDCNNISYAECKANLGSFEDPNILLDYPVTIDAGVPDSFRNLLCQNVGAVQIEWTDGTKYPDPDNSLMWRGDDFFGTTTWDPSMQPQDWPKALKFTFTLYDSKGTLKGGRRFTHIVYLGD